MLPSTPQAIGPFRVVRELGRGGMGVVYEVQDPHAPRTLALKLILPGEAGAEALARFAREAQLLARVRHPNVVNVHSLGAAADGAPYLVTDLVVGRELSKLARTGPVDPRRAAELVRTLADAVAALHERGVLHRDLKPENVFVREDGTPVLLDFGLAREVDGATLTRTGTLVGTPAYMAPEQTDGPRGLDERVDVYGLGGILFFLLAGRPPFEGTMVEVLVRVTSRDPVWPRATRPDVPAELEAICRAAMAKERDARIATAGDLRDELDRWLRGERPLAAAAATGSRRRWAGALAGVAALAIVGVAAVATRDPPAPPVDDRAPDVASVQKTSVDATPFTAALKPAEARLLDEHRERRTARVRSLVTLFGPKGANGTAYPRWLDDDTLVIAWDSDRGREVRRVSLSGRSAAATWAALEHGPGALPAPGDDAMRALAVRRAADASFALITGDSRAVARVDASTASADRLPATWTVPPEHSSVQAAPDTISGESGPPILDFYAVAASPDGRTAAVGGDWRRVWLIDLQRVRPDRHLVAARTEPGYVADLAFSPDGQQLAVIRSHQARPHPTDPLAMTYVPWRIEVWSVDGDEPRLVSLAKDDEGSPRRPRVVAWAAGLLVVGHDTGLISTWRVTPGGAELERVDEIQLPGDPSQALGAPADVQDLVAAPDGETVYAVSMERLAAIAVKAGALSWTSELLRQPAKSLDVSPDGAFLVVGDDLGAVTIWGAPPPH